MAPVSDSSANIMLSRSLGEVVIYLVGHEPYGHPSELDQYMNKMDPITLDLRKFGVDLRHIMLRAVGAVVLDRIHRMFEAMVFERDEKISGTSGEVLVLSIAMHSFKSLADVGLENSQDCVKEHLQKDDTYRPIDDFIVTMYSMMAEANWTVVALTFWKSYERYISQKNNN